MKLNFILLTLLIAAPVFAQDPARIQPARIQMDHLERLFPKAVETIDVNVDQSLIRLATKFLKTDKADEAAIREVMNMVQGVYVKGVEFDNENEFSADDIQRLRAQLTTPGWSHCRSSQQARRRERRSFSDARQRPHQRRRRPHPRCEKADDRQRRWPARS